MGLSHIRGLMACAGLLLVAGCARDPSLATASQGQRSKAAFDVARDRCGVTVVDTVAVQRCMRAQGYIYRLPWQ
jgi:hypothetical protein